MCVCVCVSENDLWLSSVSTIPSYSRWSVCQSAVVVVVVVVVVSAAVSDYVRLAQDLRLEMD